MDCSCFFYLWECYFVDASVFSFNQKTNSEHVFSEDKNLLMRATLEKMQKLSHHGF